MSSKRRLQGYCAETSHPLTLPLCTEPASAFAAAAAPAEHTPAESEEAPAAAAAAEEPPVAARTRNSPLRLVAVAHGQEGDAAEGELAVVKAKAVTVLSPEELARKRSPDFRLPFGCPTGPWGTATDALHEINHWAADHKKPGGGWSVTWLKGVLPGNSARGPQRVLGCALHKKEGCGWQGRLEQTQEGWMWYAFTEHTGGEGKQPAVGCGHSHALAVSLGQRLAHAGMREIPAELHDTAKSMRESGSSLKDVQNWLRLEAKKRTGAEPAFVYEDVRSLVGHSTSQRAWDATDFVEALARRQREEGLPYFIKLDDEGRMENAFWVTRGALEIYAVGCDGLQPRPCSGI